MAKLSGPAVFIALESSEYNGKTYHQAHMHWVEDGAVMPLRVDTRTDQKCITTLKSLPDYTKGRATVAFREIKGVTYADLCAFEPEAGAVKGK